MKFYNNTPLNFHFRETSASPQETGKTVSLVRSSSGEFSQIRPYEVGESSLRIDPKRSRFESNQIVVREYLIEKDFFVGIVISLDPILRYGTDKYSKFNCIESLLRILIASIHACEYTGKIYLVTCGETYEFSLPNSEVEFQDFLNFLSDKLYLTEKSPSRELIRKCFQDVYSGVREGGIVYLGDKIPEDILGEFAKKYHIQTAAFEIVHEDEISDFIFGGTSKREYGAYGLCTSPNNLWLLLQNAFQIW